MPQDIFFTKKSSCCDCCKRTMGFRQVKVGSCHMQIEGLDDLFQQYFLKGKTPEEMIGADMINDVKMQNFVPEDAQDLYEAALLSEYKSYCNARKN